MELILQVGIGVLVAVLAAAPVAVITRRCTRGNDGGDDRTVVAGGDATVDRSITYSPTNVTYQSVRNYITNYWPSGRRLGHGSDDDDGWSAIIGAGIAAVVATVFAVYANLFLIGSVCVTATLVIWAGLLTTTTRRQLSSLPGPTISALSNVGLVVILTTVVWTLVITTERHGVSLNAAIDTARSTGKRFPVSELVDEFDLFGVLLIALFGLAVLITLMIALIAAIDLLNWTAMLSVVANVSRGETPNDWTLRRASRFDQTRPTKTVAPTAILGLFAVLLATGLIYEWTYIPTDPTIPVPGVEASTP